MINFNTAERIALGKFKGEILEAQRSYVDLVRTILTERGVTDVSKVRIIDDDKKNPVGYEEIVEKRKNEESNNS